MRVANSVKKRCEHCQTIRRMGQLRVICSADPRHKQRQKGSKRRTKSTMPRYRIAPVSS